MFVRFEHIHPNKKLAYLDGFLCGLLAAWTLFKLKTRKA